MSSSYQPKRKELAKVKVVSSQKYKENRSKFRLVGKMLTAVVTCFVQSIFQDLRERRRNKRFERKTKRKKVKK